MVLFFGLVFSVAPVPGNFSTTPLKGDYIFLPNYLLCNDSKMKPFISGAETILWTGGQKI